MKSIIKYIAMIFSFVAVLLCLSACKSDKSENEESISEPITIHVVAFGTASDDASERVSAALSEITMEKNRMQCRGLNYFLLPISKAN